MSCVQFLWASTQMPDSDPAVDCPQLQTELMQMANFPLLRLWPLFSSLVRTPENGMKLLLVSLASFSLTYPPAQWLLPQPPALPWEPGNFLLLSGIEGEDHPFVTADGENSSFLYLSPLDRVPWVFTQCLETVGPGVKGPVREHYRKAVFCLYSDRTLRSEGFLTLPNNLCHLTHSWITTVGVVVCHDGSTIEPCGEH